MICIDNGDQIEACLDARIKGQYLQKELVFTL